MNELEQTRADLEVVTEMIGRIEGVIKEVEAEEELQTKKYQRLKEGLPDVLASHRLGEITKDEATEHEIQMATLQGQLEDAPLLLEGLNNRLKEARAIADEASKTLRKHKDRHYYEELRTEFEKKMVGKVHDHDLESSLRQVAASVGEWLPCNTWIENLKREHFNRPLVEPAL